MQRKRARVAVRRRRISHMSSARPPRPNNPLHWVAYVLSLPERVLRTIVVTAGHLLWLVLWLVPRPIRKGRFFKKAVERQVAMLTDEVGRSRRYPGSPQLTGELATRMAVGGVVDNLATISLHASPLWLLLAASDMSEGAARFVDALGAELEEKGYVTEGQRITSLDRTLKGLSALSGRLADSLDAPPLEFQALKDSVERVRDDIAEVGTAALEQVPDIDQLANELTAVSEESDRSLLSVLGALTIGTADKVERTLGATLTGVGGSVAIVTRFLCDDVLDGYVDAAKRMHRRGFVGSFRSFVRPQMRSVRALFDYSFLTWTERILSFWQWHQADWAHP